MGMVIFVIILVCRHKSKIDGNINIELENFRKIVDYN